MIVESKLVSAVVDTVFGGTSLQGRNHRKDRDLARLRSE